MNLFRWFGHPSTMDENRYKMIETFFPFTVGIFPLGSIAMDNPLIIAMGSKRKEEEEEKHGSLMVGRRI